VVPGVLAPDVPARRRGRRLQTNQSWKGWPGPCSACTGTSGAGRRVVDHVVHHHADAAPVGLRDELVEVGQRAVLGRHGAEIGGGVAVVAVGVGGDGHQPDAADAQVLQVVQALVRPRRSPMPSPSLSRQARTKISMKTPCCQCAGKGLGVMTAGTMRCGWTAGCCVGLAWPLRGTSSSITRIKPSCRRPSANGSQVLTVHCIWRCARPRCRRPPPRVSSGWVRGSRWPCARPTRRACALHRGPAVAGARRRARPCAASQRRAGGRRAGRAVRGREGMPDLGAT
jgi:hypothetical protein